MSVVTKDFIKKKPLNVISKAKFSNPLWERYMAYVEKRANEKILSYLKVIMVIPCVVMIPAIFLMAMLTTNYIWFVGVCMILFFANVLVHIAETKSTFYLPLYHASIAIMILLPILKYLFAL